MWARSISSSFLPDAPEEEALGGLKMKSGFVQLRFLSDNHGALDRILQFANVAQPRLLLQVVHRYGRDPSDALVHGQRELADEVVDEHGDVLAAVAQRRQFDAEDVEPVKKVGAELAFLDQFFEVLVGGGDAAEVHVDDLVAANAGDFALLQHPQQIGLRLEGDVADLIEENRSAFGDFELAFLAVLRAGERAFFVTEEFALEQCLGQSAAVNDDQRDEIFVGWPDESRAPPVLFQSRSRP